MPESSAFPDHPFHHYFSGGTSSVLELFAPFLALGVVSVVMPIQVRR